MYFNFVLQLIFLRYRDYCNRKFNKGPSNDILRNILLGLWCLANTETYRQIGDRFDLSRSNSHKYYHRFIPFVNTDLKKDYINWPTEERARIIIQTSNNTNRNNPIQDVLGCIDGSHIRIPEPKEEKRKYFNRKQFYSVILQVILI